MPAGLPHLGRGSGPVGLLFFLFWMRQVVHGFATPIRRRGGSAIQRAAESFARLEGIGRGVPPGQAGDPHSEQVPVTLPVRS